MSDSDLAEAFRSHVGVEAVVRRFPCGTIGVWSTAPLAVALLAGGLWTASISTTTHDGYGEARTIGDALDEAMTSMRRTK